ncbi:Transmembrane protein 45B [Hondaea fermentalgiana]|uniref:Transmembrane protein 45B n=1 Tax=Hondaea fermentalgiana TaxID=2315210 RepID=A0A2R5GSW1_9STRA|nr:Transmembrane protein 45B [Hondaea fermentalgiana]|eukprot:GBG33399.1 Transmembrane protein 45B [Hondaea fermentalgiana]
MGTLAGHVIPGAEFMILGILLNLVFKAEQFAQASAEHVACNYASVGVEDEDKELQPVRQTQPETHQKTARVKLVFSLYALISIIMGILYEGLGAVLVKSGDFFEEKGHLTMYLGFVPASIAFGLESGLFPGSDYATHVQPAPLLSQASFTMGFLNQWYLLAAHAKMKKPGADFLFHKLWADTALWLFLVYGLSVLAQLAKQERLARVAQLSCPAFLLMQGSWICLIGSIMFPVYGEMHDDVSMESISALFGLCLLVCMVLQYVFISIVPPGFARCYQRLLA